MAWSPTSPSLWFLFFLWLLGEGCLLPRLTGEPQKHPSLLPLYPRGHLESTFFLPSPHPTLAPRCTTPLSQDGGRRGKIRLKWLRRPQPCLETHIRRAVQLDELTPPHLPLPPMSGTLRLEPLPSLSSHLPCYLRQDSLSDGVCALRNIGPQNNFSLPKPVERSQGFSWCSLLSVGNS